MQENYLAKWLNNELSEEELREFKNSETFESYQKIIAVSDTMKAPEFDSEKALHDLKNRIVLDEKPTSKVIAMRPYKRFMQIAAAVAVLLTGSYFYLGTLGQNFSTQYAELKEITLPDNSEIVLNADSEILPLMGSKEGIMHISMAFLNAGDSVLVPNPGYLTYSSVAKLMNTNILTYDLQEKNNWEPDWEALEKMDLEKVKIMWTNYPNMPTGADASESLFERLITFAHKHRILIVNDNPYSFILNDKPIFLSLSESWKNTEGIVGRLMLIFVLSCGLDIFISFTIEPPEDASTLLYFVTETLRGLISYSLMIFTYIIYFRVYIEKRLGSGTLKLNTISG